MARPRSACEYELHNQKEDRQYRPDQSRQICRPVFFTARNNRQALAMFGEKAGQFPRERSAILLECGHVTELRQLHLQSRARGLFFQRRKRGCLLPRLEIKPRKRLKNRNSIAIPVLANEGLQKAVKLRVMRVMNASCRHRHILPFDVPGSGSGCSG